MDVKREKIPLLWSAVREKSMHTHTHIHTVQRVKLASTSVLVECEVASDMTNHFTDPPPRSK